MRIRILVPIVVAALALTPAAVAHVTVNPPEAAAESFARFDIRVPTERGADTIKVAMQIPEGLFFVSFQPKAGWKRTVKMEKLDQPVEIFGEEITERVAQVTWSGGRIGPGEFDEFGMSARMPQDVGTELVFPAVQTYSNGDVVRWIGPPDSETPAPVVTVTEPEEEGATQPAASPPPPAAAQIDDEGSDTLALVALIVALAGLLAALAAVALVWTRTPRGAATRP